MLEDRCWSINHPPAVRNHQEVWYYQSVFLRRRVAGRQATSCYVTSTYHRERIPELQEGMSVCSRRMVWSL